MSSTQLQVTSIATVSKLDLDTLSSGFIEEIKRFLKNSSKSLLYHDPDYLKLIQTHLCCEAGYLVVFENNNIEGLLPYAEKSGSLGKVYNSFAYYGSNGGVLCGENDFTTRKQLIEAFYQLLQSDGSLSATIITNPLDSQQQSYFELINTDFMDERIGQLTPLPALYESDESLMSMFDAPRPRNIRKALKCGVTIEKRQDKKAIEFLYETHFQNITAIGGQAKSRAFFDLIPDTVPNEKWGIYIACIEQKPVAALLIFFHDNCAEYFTPCVLSDFRNSQALSLAIFEAMKDAIELKIRYWNWGGTWLSQDGVYDFKKRWGTQDFNYFYHTKIANKALLKADKRSLLAEYQGFFTLPFSALTSEVS